jgi:hypothetical protein
MAILCHWLLENTKSQAGAGTGAGVGAGSEVITKGDQVKIPSEILLEFTLQQSVTIPKQPA